MPWRAATIRGQRVLAKAKPDGTLDAQGGRVEIRYKPTDPRAYHAAARNLELLAEPLLPDDACVPGEAPAPKASKTASKAAAAKVVHRTSHETAFVAYTDGACKGNPGVAASACVLVAPDGKVTEEGRYLGHTTNNVAELTGALQALELAPAPAELIVHTDSKYAIGVLSQGWKAKANQELIASVKAAMKRHDKVHFVYVPGHSGVPLNERADELANEAIREGRTIMRVVERKA